MPFSLRIPFSSKSLTIGTQPNSASRGLSTGKYSGAPERDLTGFKFDVSSLYTSWRNSGDVFGCVREIRQGTGIGGFYFYDPSDDKKEKPAPEALVKQLTSVLTYQYKTLRTFKDRVMEPRLIAGNTYIEKIRNPLGGLLGVKTLDPRTMAVVSNEHGNVFKYIQSVYSQGEKSVMPVEFEPEDIIHWKWGSDPNAEVFGFSAMEPILWEVRTDLSAMISNYFFFENDAVPSVWYMLDDQLSDEEAKRAMSEGCFCYPNDREQALCAQHVIRATPIGAMELVVIYQPWFYQT
jgi:phage portal protein BeeE